MFSDFDSFTSCGNVFHVLMTLFEKKFFLRSVLDLEARFALYAVLLVNLEALSPTKLNHVEVSTLSIPLMIF